MKRREFLGKSLAASMALTPLTAFASNSNSRHLVAGAQDRASYMAKMLDTLCTHIGPRFAGSASYDRSAELIRQQMALAMPKTELDWFDMRAWRLLEEPIFYCGGRSLECYPTECNKPPDQLGTFAGPKCE